MKKIIPEIPGEMSYNLAGYYVIRKKPLAFGSKIQETIYTCSSCINDSLLEHWSYSWTTDNNGYIDKIQENYQITEDAVNSIRKWADNALDNKKVGWINVFADLSTAKEYKKTFFAHLSDIDVMAVYLSKKDSDALIKEFQPKEENFGLLGLYENLIKTIPEIDSESEKFLGFDIIGIELDGGFHSFHCHDISDFLVQKFALRPNQYGLFQEVEDWTPILDHMNDQESGYEPVPWFVCKTKLVI